MNQTKAPTCHPDRKYHAKGLCRPCYTQAKGYYTTQKRRNTHLRDTYGIDQEAFDWLLDTQKGLCAICEELLALEGPNRSKRACIDHDHVTNKVRGILCHECNLAVGLLQDNPTRMVSAANYVMGYDLAKIG